MTVSLSRREQLQWENLLFPAEERNRCRREVVLEAEFRKQKLVVDTSPCSQDPGHLARRLSSERERGGGR